MRLPSEFVAVTRNVEKAATVEKAVLSIVVRVVSARVGAGVGTRGAVGVGITEKEGVLPCGTQEVDGIPGKVTVKGELMVETLVVVRVVP